MPGIDFTSVSPIVPVRNLDIALERYRRLGFDARAYEGPDRYGFVDRGSVSMHLSEWVDHDPLRTAASVYLYVSDADALYAEWAGAGKPRRALRRAFRHPLRLKGIRVRRSGRHRAPRRLTPSCCA